MDLPIINMSRWMIHICNNWVYLSGIADNHPKLGLNANVSHTSEITEVISYNDDILRVKTHNSIYVCPLKYLSKKFIKNDLTKVDDIQPELYKLVLLINRLADDSLNDSRKQYFLDLIEQGEKELKQKKEEENKRLISLIQDKENSIYLEVSSINSGNVLAYNIDGKTGIVEPEIHVGMFQDSILYMEYGLVDFRYFPKGTSMEIYSWSDNIERVIIKNIKKYDIKVDEQLIKAGDTVEINKNDYRCGLISPNCVNGSSLLIDRDNQDR